MKYHPTPSTRDIGLQIKLDSEKSKHYGFGYKEFVVLSQEAKLNPANLAKAFNIKRRETILNWLKVYEEEQGINQ